MIGLGWGSSRASCGTEARRDLVSHLVPVRDYKDKFILHLLQAEARGESPGFLFIRPGERANIMWAEVEGERAPAGYYVCWDPRRAFSKHAHEYVRWPATFSQVYVVPGMRRRGMATRMLQDFIGPAPPGEIWVESPRAETVALLHKLGYREPNQPYELWQVMEGLSRWVPAEEIGRGRAGLSPGCPEAWLWARDGGMSGLR